MPHTLRLIEQVRRKVPKHTDYAVAKALEMNQSQLSQVLCGKCGIGPKAVIRISEILDIDVRYVLVTVEAEQARRPKDIEFWARRSARGYNPNARSAPDTARVAKRDKTVVQEKAAATS